MAMPSCSIDGERYTYSLSLISPSSFRSSTVHVDGGRDVQLRVITEAGAHTFSVLLLVEEDLPTDIFAIDVHVWPERPSMLSRLVDSYDALCSAGSPRFLPTADDGEIVRQLFGHGLVVGTTCASSVTFRNRIVEHLLAGLCASERGPLCQEVVSTCRAACVYPQVFMLSCIVSSGIIGSVDSACVPMYADFFVPAVGRNRRKAAGTAALGRLSAVRYAPYVDERSYLLRIVNAQFERMTEDELKRIAVAHSMLAVSLLVSPSELRKAISEHLFLGHCLFKAEDAIPTIPVGCLDFLADNYFSRNI
ncbi:uncharacterized protein ARMOST_07489 [Armillaria ostoyae]|uniref:Uncharacterized protein n=1 Tax=Armillaria ostoyae TaxID=47428 RepID=A0A284R5Y9_ARMOS|nr:uncharacterized protein ARMOST_07489 [Armillaria ostoyae]